MKKYLFALLGLLALGVCLMLLLPGEDAITELNENSLLPVRLCTPEAQALAELTESLIYVPGFGEYALDNDDICIYFGGWPDVQDPYHVTRVELFTPGYHVLGLQVGDSSDAARQVLTDYGYAFREENGWLIGTKGDVVVTADITEGAVARIHASVVVTNKDNIVF